ncbi:hypothetical protein [Rufibacter hautae]|uniref:Uncharacterized protein n=1 Tax=Rufibacter hautae TaxID=2595005 RepID=A0A5B6TAQ4_9BACT|nr:hypothetical protein [Rufibacter hautae]KAA3436074.1 hypothetical protein FOA19_16860 [Rufibacter hautae]
MFSLRFTLALLALLLIPYFLRSKYGIALEPYPAVMLPSGSGKVDVAPGRTKVKFTSLYALNAQGTWSKVDNTHLLYPIPIQYLNPILAKEFGLKENAGAIRPGIQSELAENLSMSWARKVTEQDKNEVKVWLRRKLEHQNLHGPSLKVVQTVETISIPDGRILNSRVAYENTLRLDQ